MLKVEMRRFFRRRTGMSGTGGESRRSGKDQSVPLKRGKDADCFAPPRRKNKANRNKVQQGTTRGTVTHERRRISESASHGKSSRDLVK
jgi:hypothetical protein